MKNLLTRQLNLIQSLNFTNVKFYPKDPHIAKSLLSTSQTTKVKGGLAGCHPAWPFLCTPSLPL